MKDPDTMIELILLHHFEETDILPDGDWDRKTFIQVERNELKPVPTKAKRVK
jgi:hypothetical protein